MNRLVKPGRLAFCIFLLVALVALYVTTLFKLQIIEGAAYAENSRNNIVTTKTVTAARGNILDRYGRVLVSNRVCNNLTIDVQDLFAQGDTAANAIILDMVRAIQSCGNTHADTLPISMDPPFEYSYSPRTSDHQRALLEAYVENATGSSARLRAEFGSEPTAVELMAYFRDRYQIDNNYSAQEMRIIAGVRYEINVRYIINTSEYIFCEDVSIELITKLMENNLPGFDVVESYIREYNTIYASHILGYVGQVFSGEYESYYEKLGYPMSAMVGKDGVEREFESYLHGVDGEVLITTTRSGTITGKMYTLEPEPGGNIYLTIDIGLQEASEQALANGINQLNRTREVENAEHELYGRTDKITPLSTGGAAVVIDIKTGEPLAMASYPGFSLQTFQEDYNDLLEDPSAPLYNRALQGTYAPGSTFKMVTALTALCTERNGRPIITINTPIYDEGKFMKYADYAYAPTCWIYPGSHGELNVISAIENSCNYFFYTLGDALYIEELEDYANRFGLGVATGIELPEALGNMSSNESKMRIDGDEWRAGDTLQAAIGQSYSIFTPLQIASYIATLANDGVRYSTSILKSVRSFDNTEKIYEREPEVLETVGGDQEFYDAIKQGMHDVVLSGTAREIFKDFQIDIAAKTGTAQLGESNPNNGVFVCYAPYDDPQIAIAIVVEKGGSGSAIASIAKEILNYYFKFQSGTANMEAELALLR